MTCNNEGRPVPAGTAPSNNHHRDHAGNEADGQATEPRHCPVAAATKPKPPPPRDSEAGLEDSMSEGRGMGGGRFKRPQAPPIQTLPPQPPQAAPLPSPKIPTNGHSRSIKQEYLPAPTEAAGHAPDEYEIQLPEIVDVVRDATFKRFDRWVRWVENAKPVPEEEQLALMKRDHIVRELGYTQDPMNVISERMLGKERTQEMLAVRYGKAQIEASEKAAGLR